MSPIERELVRLARKAHERPRELTPGDLKPLRRLVGDGALDYAQVVGAFHFVNRIADLLGVKTDTPTPPRRLGWLRQPMMALNGFIVRRLMSLRPRRFEGSAGGALARLAPEWERATGERLGHQLDGLRRRPALIESARLRLSELSSSTLDAATLKRVFRTVEQALPAGPADLAGFHPRPADAVEAFAFVGTRYPGRTTPQMIEALRGAGYDDRGILDLAIAVATANHNARLYRLLGVPQLVQPRF